ncbi:MAG: tetratricopeptide repeat protein [Bacteroidales bacterium]|nr:tetratricopeptide repeat protein [Bacteroidales bacterium]
MKRLISILVFVCLAQLLWAQTANEFFERGKEKANLGKYKEAIYEFNRAIETDRKFAKAYNSRGVVKEIIGDFRGAIKDYSTAIDIEPGFYLAYYNRGLVKIFMGQQESGCEDLDKAEALGHRRAIKAKKECCK